MYRHGDLLISVCTAFEHWPEDASVSLGRLSIRACHRLSYLPSWLTNLAQLDISNCEQISEIPEGLKISSWLDGKYCG